MKYQQDLQVRLQQRYRRVYKCDHNVFNTEVRYFRDFILEVPSLRAVTEAVIRATKDFDPAAWVAANFEYRGYSWPPSETERARVAWHLVNHWADGADPMEFHFQFSTSGGNLNDTQRNMVGAIIEPFVEYVEERLSTESDVLYLLEKYKRRVEWFQKASLYREYQAGGGEAMYDADLRRYLFDQGIEYPFSQPRSASGQADVISDLDTDDPLVTEIKLFDADRYGVAYVAKGFQQALSYADDHNKQVAHLVVFNLSDKRIEFESEADPSAWPSRLTVAGITVYMIAIQAKPLPSASTRSTLVTVSIGREDLVRETVATTS